MSKSGIEDLIDFWRHFSATGGTPCVHEDDLEVMKKVKRTPDEMSSVSKYFELTSPDQNCYFHLSLTPVPYMGDLGSADIFLVARYADDLVVGFQHRTDAERFLEEFRERLAKFGLQLHPDKTRLIEFGRFAARDLKARGEGKPETFTFLGFTHFCGQRYKSGTFTGIMEEIIRIEDVRLIPPVERVRPKRTGSETPLLEVVLHRADAYVLEGFREYLQVFGLRLNLDERIVVQNLCFLPVRVPPELHQEMAKFSFLRVAREMPAMREL